MEQFAGLTADQIRLAARFFPHNLKAASEVMAKGTRFVHYTSAEVAYQIINTGQVWMRNAQVMNDFSEIEYGMTCLVQAYHGGLGDSLKSLLNGIFSGINEEIERLFDGWLPAIRTETYLTCVSEHMDDEDFTGRLSMWRAYGGESGVAIVVNNTPFMSATGALGAFSSQVEYIRQAEFDRRFQDIIDAISKEKELVSSLPREVVISNIFSVFRYAVLCTKHPGFAEECEWRVMHAPNLHDAGKITHAFEVVHGVPQSVYKIPLADFPDEGIFGLSIPSFLNRVIIGPVKLPGTLYSTFHKVLTAKGVQDVERKLCITDIPLRR